MSGDGMEHDWLYDGRGETAYCMGMLKGADLVLYKEYLQEIDDAKAARNEPHRQGDVPSEQG